MAEFKVGDRVVLKGENLPDEPGVVEAIEAKDMYIVRVDKPIQKGDDRLREVIGTDMVREVYPPMFR